MRQPRTSPARHTAARAAHRAAAARAALLAAGVLLASAAGLAQTGPGRSPTTIPPLSPVPAPPVPGPSGGSWQTGIEPAPARSGPAAPPAAAPPALPNTTVVPRSAPEPRPGGGGTGQVAFVAMLTDDGQRIDQGLVWRIYADKPGPDGKNRLIQTSREAAPALRLPPGDYIVHVGFGRAHLSRKIAVPATGAAVSETFVLNAGGLRVTARLASGEVVPANAASYDIYTDERDQFGNRTKLMSGAKPGLIVRLNSGIYQIVSTYGDANATVRADVTVEAGKLTEVTATHATAKVMFKLVTRAGGEAIADTQWSIATIQGEPVKESVGALPTHALAPGTYTVHARSAGKAFRRDFAVRAGDNVYVEIIAQ